MKTNFPSEMSSIFLSLQQNFATHIIISNFFLEFSLIHQVLIQKQTNLSNNSMCVKKVEKSSKSFPPYSQLLSKVFWFRSWTLATERTDYRCNSFKAKQRLENIFNGCCFSTFTLLLMLGYFKKITLTSFTNFGFA